MKIKLIAFNKKAASSLLVTLFMMTILAISIAGYLYYVQQQNFLGTRAQSWNVAMAISEAGIEEGLQAINVDPLSPIPSASDTCWEHIGGNVYVLHRTLPYGEYYVTNDCATEGVKNPVLTCRAFVNAPKLVAARPGVFFAAASVSAEQPRVTRAVQVKTRRGSYYLVAIAAKNTVTMDGNFGLTDSYDSADTAHFTNGVYNPTFAGTNGDVATLDGFVNAGNFDIHGDIATGPNGDVTSHNNGSYGTVTHDANFTFPDTSLPSHSGYTQVPTYAIGDPAGDISTISGTTTNMATNSVTYNNQTNPPPAAGANQYISGSTNTAYITTTTNPGSQPGLVTNTTVLVNHTNRTVTMTASNLICGATVFSGNNLPASGVCSFTTQGGGHGASSYRWTLIAGTNVTYLTNLTYDYTTNSTYTYQQTTYTYTIFTYSETVVPSYVTTHYDHIICGNMFTLGDLGGSTYISCPSELIMPNGLNMNSGDAIIVGESANVEVHAGGDSMTIKGNGVINKTGIPANFIVFATTNVTDLQFAGNAAFTGVIVAPGANATLDGGGNDVRDFSGALMANTVTLHGHFQFHYDEALSRRPGDARFLAKSWKEFQ